MAIKVANLFGELALESTLRKILSAVTFAKSPTDQLRTVIDSGTVVSTVYAAGSSGTIGATNVAPYSPLAWNAHDVREQYQVETQQNFMVTRNRWTIT